MINSQTFMRRNGVMVRKGYLNLKFVTGLSLKGGDSEAKPTDLGRDLSKMVELCPWTACSIPAVFARFKQDWFGALYHPNWYLPVHLGGFGLSLDIAPSTVTFTRNQRRFAAAFVADPKLALYRRKGFTIPVAQYAGAVAKWEMYPIGPTVLRSGQSFDLDDEWLARIAYAVRASQMGKTQVSDAVAIAKLKPNLRQKPMSVGDLARYWSVHVASHGLPACPPLEYL